MSTLEEKTNTNKMETAVKIKKIWLPESSAALFLRIAGLAVFGFRFFKEVFSPPYEIKETLKQCYSIGYKSLSLIGVTGFIIGLTLTLQSIPTLSKFGAQSLGSFYGCPCINT